MKRLPVLAAALVAIAVAAMIGLGVWQLRRADEKAVLLALYERNRAMSSEIALPIIAPVPDTALFRHASAMCLEVTEWRAVAGRGIDGRNGWRYLASCRRASEGPGFIANMGVASTANLRPAWKGGAVSGQVSLEPVASSLIATLVGRGDVPRPMIVAGQPAPGLAPSAAASPEDMPNNHLAYAVQWFVFAGIAALIFGIALWRRRNDAPPA